VNHSSKNTSMDVPFGHTPDDREEVEQNYQFLDQLTAGVLVFFLGILLCIIVFFSNYTPL
jgi:hypothetical protein